MSRYAQRTQTALPILSTWGKTISSSPTYGTATGGTSSTITVSGTSYTRLLFTTDGTLTVTKAGVFDVLAIGGGGGGGANSYGFQQGNGGGGGWLDTQIYLPVGTFSIYIGAGGAGRNQGRSTGITNYFNISGGGRGGDAWFDPIAFNNGTDGASGGGAATNANGTYGSAGSGQSGIGNNGGNATGGGAGAAGSSGGAAKDFSYWLGQSAGTTYYAGGGGTSTGAGTAGSGGNGGYAGGVAGIFNIRFA